MSIKIGERVTQLFSTTDLNNHEILRIINLEYPQNQTKIASISWYRCKYNQNKPYTKSKSNVPQKPRTIDADLPQGRWIFVEDQYKLNL
jgi:hypothetical protein